MKKSCVVLAVLLIGAACQESGKSSAPDLGSDLVESDSTAQTKILLQAEPESYEFGAAGAPPVENVSFTVTNVGTERINFLTDFRAPDNRERNQFDEEVIYDDLVLQVDEAIVLNIEFRRGTGEANLVGGVGWYRVIDERTEDELARIDLTVADLTEQ